MTLPLERLAQLAALATGIQIGAAIVASRIAIADLGPLTVACLRYVIATACLALPYFAMRRAPIAPRDRLPLVLLGIGQFAALIALLNIGLVFVTADRAAVGFASLPLMTMLVAAALGRERLSWRLSAAALLAFAGIAVAFSEGLGLGDPLSDLVGTACVLAATLTGAVCSVFFGAYLRRYPTLQVGTLAMATAAVALLPAAAMELWVADSFVPTSRAILALVFVGVSSAGGFLLWLFALKHSSAGRTTLLASGSPLVAALVSAWLLDAPLSLRVAGGFCLVLLALVISLRARGGRAPQAAAG